MPTRLRFVLLLSTTLLMLVACSNPMRPQQELETYCKALGDTEADAFLRANHASQMAAIQQRLNRAKVTPEFAKLVRLAAPLHPTQIQDALQGYADIKGVKYSCTKAQQQARRRDAEKQARLKAARDEGADQDELAAAAVDPTFTPPFDTKAVQGRVGTHLSSLQK